MPDIWDKHGRERLGKGSSRQVSIAVFFFLKFMSCEKVLGPVPSCYFVTNPLNRNITIKLINKPRCPLSGGYPVQGCICLLNFSLISLSTFLFFFFLLGCVWYISRHNSVTLDLCSKNHHRHIYPADGSKDEGGRPVGIWEWQIGETASQLTGRLERNISSAQTDKVSYVNWCFSGQSFRSILMSISRPLSITAAGYKSVK